MLPTSRTVPTDPERRRPIPRTLRPEHRDLLHPVLAADAATTAAALGDALMGGDVEGGRLLRERLEAELLLLDDLAWSAQVVRETFALRLPTSQLARAGQRLHRVGVEMVAERNETAPEQRSTQIEADYALGLRVVLLSAYLLRDLPRKLLTETSEPMSEVC